MKNLLALFVIAALFISCSESPTVGGSGQGRVIVEAFDAPGPDGVEAILLHVIEVSLHNEDSGWLTLAEPDTVINFFDLVNGVTTNLGDDSINVGQYSQLRLLLGDTNQIVINGDTLPLTTPSGQSSGIKLNLDFTLDHHELIRLYVDFDASKSIVSASDKYLLHPSFKVFKEVLSGRISGMVADNTGAPIEGALVEAMSTDHETSTITDSDGNYMLILPAGLYEISASATGYTTADTTYTDVEVTAGMLDMMNLDFVLE